MQDRFFSPQENEHQGQPIKEQVEEELAEKRENFFFLTMKPNDSVVEDDSRDDEMILYENRKKD